MRAPRFERRNVSGAIPTLKEAGGWEGRSVIVRQVPFTQILSPSLAFCRTSPASDIVKDVPPPPDVEMSRGSSAVTAVDD